MKKILSTIVFLFAIISSALALPTMNVKKLKSTAKYTGLARGSITTSEFIGGICVGQSVDDSGWLKEVMSAQVFEISISAKEVDIGKKLTLNILTIVKSRRSRGGYGYSKQSSFNIVFSRTGAMDGSLKLVFITPQFAGERDKSGFGEDMSDGWVVNGIAVELVNAEDGKILRTWSNSSLANKFSGGFSKFFSNLPHSINSDAIYAEKEAGYVANVSKYITIEENKQ